MATKRKGVPNKWWCVGHCMTAIVQVELSEESTHLNRQYCDQIHVT